MATLITSQHYLNDEIVAAKIADRDYAVAVSPEFEVDGETYQVVLDGHHSLAAALATGSEPEITEYDACDHDAICVLNDGNVELFLRIVYMDGAYINAITHRAIW